MEIPLFGLDVRGLHGIHLVAGKQRLKPRLGQGPAQDLRHIIAAGIVVGIADAVGVGKVGVLEAQFRHLGVHGRHAARNGAIPEIFGQQVGAIVGAGHHGGIEGIRQGHMLPLLQGNVAGIRPREGIDILVGHFQAHTVPLALGFLTGKAQRHHLGDGRRVQLFVHILLGQHKAGVRVDDAVRLRGRQRRARGPRHGCKHRADPEQHRAKHGDLFFHLVISPLVI